MALVVFLRGINVGGHRRFRPAALAARLSNLGMVNVGAAGTFVVRKPVQRRQLRLEISTHVPFPVQMAISDGREVIHLLSQDHFAGFRKGPDVIRFAAILASAPRLKPDLPVILPARGKWFVNVLAHEGPFVVGFHRRAMRAIGYLGELDRMFGVRATVRSWSTMVKIARILDEGAI